MAENRTDTAHRESVTWGHRLEGYKSDYPNGRFAWFNQAKFGIFIHWGVYSLLEGEWNGREHRGIAEWIMNVLEIPIAEYEKIAANFNPEAFDAAEWVGLFKEAGAQYVTITSKHHDGFALFDSRADPFNVVQASAYKKDLIKAMADACIASDLRLCVYYSQDLDWHEQHATGNTWDFDPREITVEGREEYLHRKVIPQLEELLTNYGDLGYIWFDCPASLTEAQCLEIKRVVAEHQPDCLSSDRLGHGLGDFQSLPDQMVPNTLSYDRAEAAMTHNDSWAYSKFDKNYKSAKTLIRQLVQTVSRGANYLLNVGPKADGSLAQEDIEALREIGGWMKLNGESIYNTVAAPIQHPLPWGVCTFKVPNKLYLHVMAWPADGRLLLPLNSRVTSAAYLADGRPLAFSQGGEFTVIHLPAEMPDDRVTVIALEYELLAQKPYVMPTYENPMLPHMFDKFDQVEIKKLSWMHETFGNWKHHDALIFERAGTSVSRTIEVVADGNYEVTLSYDFPPADPNGTRHTHKGPVEPTGRDPMQAVILIDAEAYNVELPYIPPCYFGSAIVAEVPLRKGEHTLTLKAMSDNFAEIVRLSLTSKA